MPDFTRTDSYFLVITSVTIIYFSYYAKCIWVFFLRQISSAIIIFCFFVTPLWTCKKTLQHLWKVPAAVEQVGRKNRSVDNIPPTKDALLQHVKHASYQAGHAWDQSLIADPGYPVLVTGIENRLLIYDWLSSDWYDITIRWQHLPVVHQMTVFSAGNLEMMADITENDVHVR